MDLPNLPVPKFLDEAATPVAREIGEGLGNLFYLVFSPIHKARYKREFEIEAFVETLKSNVEEIPEDKLVEPPLHIVGPALEASKYYYQEKDLRDMFAKLISASMNSDLEGKVRSSFVDIIKQMEPLDAVILRELHRATKPGELLGVGKVIRKFSPGIKTIYDNFFPLECLTEENYGQVGASISNIIRLGLISVNDMTTFIEKAKYEAVKNHHFFQWILKNSEDSNKIEIKEMTWDFTALGYDFVDCCLPMTDNITAKTFK